MKIFIAIFALLLSAGALADCYQGTEQVQRELNVRFYNPCAGEMLQGIIKHHMVIKCEYDENDNSYLYQRHINYQGQLQAPSGEYVVKLNQKYDYERIYNPNEYEGHNKFKMKFVPKGRDGVAMNREYDCSYGWRDGAYFQDCKATGQYECR